MKLSEIVDKPSSFIKKRFPQIYQQVIDYCDENNLHIEDIHFKQKLFHFYHHISQRPKCIICKTNVTNFETFKTGYKKYCSCKCRANDPEWEMRKQNTVRKKYAVDNVSQLQSIKNKKHETVYRNYGVNAGFWANNKCQKTWVKTMGVINPSKNENIKKRISNGLKNANIERGNEIKLKRTATLLIRHKVFNPGDLVKNVKTSKVERVLKEYYNINSIKLENHWEYDLYFEKENIIIEIDGYRHPKRFFNITYEQIVPALNDYFKEELAVKKGYKFYRIKWEIVQDLYKNGRLNEISIDFMIKNSYTVDRQFNKICDVVSKAEILKLQEISKSKPKIFAYKMIRLMYLLQTFKQIKYNTLPEFLFKEYGIIYENKYSSKTSK